MTAVAKAALPRFVELVRVSTRDQADRDTAEIQRHALDAMREREPGTLVARIEVPEGISGAKDFAQRPDLQRLERLAKDKAFDQLRVYAVDRITRHHDVRERFKVFGLLLDAGAMLLDTQGQRIGTDETGEMSWFFQTSTSAKEHKTIRRRMSDGKKERAANGLLAQGQPPFGRTYKKTGRKTGEWGIDPERAKTYRRMFDLCLAGKSLNEIAATLNAEGKITRRGCAWTGSNVCKLLREPAATGRYTSQGHTFPIPAIVDEATFHAVDAKLRGNNSMSGPKPTVFSLLRKILTCAVCGEPMYIQKGGGTPSRFHYYRCKSGDDACLAYHRVEATDDRIISALRAMFSDPERLERLMRHEAADREDPAAIAKRMHEAAKADLRRLDKREANLVRLVTKGLVSDKVGEGQLEEIRRLRAAAQVTIADATALRESASRDADTETALRAEVERLRHGLASVVREDWRMVVESLFPKGGIRIHPTGKLEVAGWVGPPPASPNASPFSGRR